MKFLSESLEKYVEQHSSKEDAVLHTLSRQTHQNVLLPQMLSGHIQGQFLSMVSQMIQPEYVLEIGTFTGYSAICLAAGLKKSGQLITIDINEELKDMAESFFEKANLKDKINMLIGSALDIIPALNDGIDLAFIDADKVNYSNYYNLVFPKVKPGGFILVDNVLWSGKVVEEKKDKDTQAIHAFNVQITADDRVENTLLPIRDGIMMIRKK